MKISEYLKKPFVCYNEKLSTTFDLLPSNHKLREVICRITCVALVIFAEAIFGILWVIGRALSCNRQIARPPKIESRSVEPARSQPEVPSSANNSKSTTLDRFGYHFDYLDPQDAPWDQNTEVLPYDESLNSYALTTFPQVPAALGAHILSFIPFPGLLKLSPTSKIFHRISTYYQTIFRNTARLCTYFEYPIDDENVEKRRILFRGIIKKLRPVDSNLVVYQQEGWSPNTTTLLLQTLQFNHVPDFRFEVASALLEKKAKADLSAGVYVKISPLEAARQTNNQQLIDLIQQAQL